LGDQSGKLSMLVLENDGVNVTNLHLETLGDITIPSTLSYLDNSVVYVGSTYGDCRKYTITYCL
jgi:hypothetical protein